MTFDHSCAATSSATARWAAVSFLVAVLTLACVTLYSVHVAPSPTGPTSTGSLTLLPPPPTIMRLLRPTLLTSDAANAAPCCQQRYYRVSGAPCRQHVGQGATSRLDHPCRPERRWSQTVRVDIRQLYQQSLGTRVAGGRTGARQQHLRGAAPLHTTPSTLTRRLNVGHPHPSRPSTAAAAMRAEMTSAAVNLFDATHGVGTVSHCHLLGVGSHITRSQHC